MTRLNEEAFRALLDARGILRAGALAAPHPSEGYLVFAQQEDVRLEVGALKQHAERFFRTKIGLTADKEYVRPLPSADAARVVVASPSPRASGTRLCYGRATTARDLQRAEAAEQHVRTHGLALLARRCKTVWTITTESDDDAVALVIAVICASVWLGPIVTPDGTGIDGVRGGRLKLEGMGISV